MSFHVDTMSFILILIASVLFALVFLVAAPILAIEWFWNTCLSGLGMIPAIGIFQAALLYVASVVLIYLSGLVRIEVNVQSGN